MGFGGGGVPVARAIVQKGRQRCHKLSGACISHASADINVERHSSVVNIKQEVQDAAKLPQAFLAKMRTKEIAAKKLLEPVEVWERVSGCRRWGLGVGDCYCSVPRISVDPLPLQP